MFKITLLCMGLSLSGLAHAASSGCPLLRDLSESAVRIASEAPFFIPRELALQTLNGPDDARFLQVLKAAHWLNRPSMTPFLEALAKNLYDPNLNRKIQSQDSQWTQALGQTAPEKLNRNQIQKAILAETLKQTDTQLPQAVAQAFLPGLEQLPVYTHLGAATTNEEHENRIQLFLSRPIPLEVRRWLVRPPTSPIYHFNSRQTRRQEESTKTAGVTEQAAQVALRKTMASLIEAGRFRDLSPETPGAKERLKAILNKSSQTHSQNPAVSKYINSYFSFVLLGEKSSALSVQELKDSILPPLIARARHLANEERKRQKEFESAHRATAMQEMPKAAPMPALAKRDVRPIAPEALNRSKPEPVQSKKSLVTDKERELAQSRVESPVEESGFLSEAEWIRKLSLTALNPKQFEKFLEDLKMQPEGTRKSIYKSLEELARTKTVRGNEFKKANAKSNQAIYQISARAKHSDARILLAYEDNGTPRIISARVDAKAGNDFRNRRQDDWISNAVDKWLQRNR